MGTPTKFVQIIDFETGRFDEMRALAKEMEKRFSGRESGPTRHLVLKDRNQPGRYLEVLEFNSFEEVMRNSQDPETSEFAEQMAALCTRPPSFVDCDLLEMSDLT